MGKVVARTASCFVFLLFLLAGKVAGRHLQYDAAELVSNGVSDGEEESFLHLKGMDSSEGNCHQMYGFLPCSTNLPGHFFLIVIYGYLLYCGESFVRGDERYPLFGKDYWGSVCFQLLNSFPEPLVLAASVVLSNNEAAEEHLVVAVGLLVGSSILLLTIVWGFCIIFGRRKFDGNENNHGLRLLTGSGVVTDSETKLHAKFMLVSLMPFIVIIIPMAVGVSSAFQKYVLALSLLVAVICLFCYFLYQNVSGRIWIRTQEYAEMERKVKMRVPFYDVQALMQNRNKHLMHMGKEMEKKMETNDRNLDDPCSDKSRTKLNQETDGDQKAEAKGRIDGKLKAIAFLGIGIFMLIFFTEPLSQSVQIFSKSLNISPFYISFIFLPLATNARTALAAFGAAKQKRYKISSTFSEIYHKVFMNNLMGFALLLSVMYFRGFTWHFSAELLTLVIVCAVMGLLASFNPSFPTGHCSLHSLSIHYL